MGGRGVRVRILGVAVTFLLIAGSAAAKETVYVAFLGPLTGGVSANGIGGRNSADLAVRLRNADPNARYRYELISYDTECKPSTGVQVATRAAADRRVVAAVAHYCSVVALATVHVYHRFGLPIVVWGAVHPDITYGNDYREIHRINGTMINQNEVASKFMRSLGYETWAILYDTTDYGKGHKKYFTKYLQENGGKVLASFGVTPDQQDFTAELTEIKALDPQVVYFGGLTPLGVRIRAQMERIGLTSQFEGTSGIMSDAYIEALGPLAEGTLAFREGAPVDKLPGGRFFVEKYREQGYKEPPEAYGPFAFAAMNLVLDIIERVGPDREKVRDALNAVKDYDTIVGPVTFDANGQNVVPLITKYVVQDGRWTVWEDSAYARGERRLRRLGE